jgi:RNA recognition motif-containing protein
MKDARIIYQYDSETSRGFGFVIYKSIESVYKVLKNKEKHILKDKWVDCKHALLKEEIKNMNPESLKAMSGKRSKKSSDSTKQKPKMYRDSMSTLQSHPNSQKAKPRDNFIPLRQFESQPAYSQPKGFYTPGHNPHRVPPPGLHPHYNYQPNFHH